MEARVAPPGKSAADTRTARRHAYEGGGRGGAFGVDVVDRRQTLASPPLRVGGAAGRGGAPSGLLEAITVPSATAGRRQRGRIGGRGAMSQSQHGLPCCRRTEPGGAVGAAGLLLDAITPPSGQLRVLASRAHRPESSGEPRPARVARPARGRPTTPSDWSAPVLAAGAEAHESGDPDQQHSSVSQRHVHYLAFARVRQGGGSGPGVPAAPRPAATGLPCPPAVG